MPVITFFELSFQTKCLSFFLHHPHIPTIYDQRERKTFPSKFVTFLCRPNCTSISHQSQFIWPFSSQSSNVRLSIFPWYSTHSPSVSTIIFSHTHVSRHLDYLSFATYSHPSIHICIRDAKTRGVHQVRVVCAFLRFRTLSQLYHTFCQIRWFRFFERNPSHHHLVYDAGLYQIG